MFFKKSVIIGFYPVGSVYRLAVCKARMIVAVKVIGSDYIKHILIVFL